MDIADLLIRIVEVEKALENYREYRTAIEDLETDVMYLKEGIIALHDHIKTYHELVLGACPIDIEKTIRKNMKNSDPIEIEIHEMKQQIECLFISLKGVETKIRGNIFQPLKPHTCPVCQGSGKHFIDPNSEISGIEGAFLPKDMRELSYRECHACEAKGVVWG